MSAVSQSAARPDAVLEDWLHARHSCRAFLPDAVPRAVIERILLLAQRTASWCNCQPWQVALASGDGARRLSQALLQRAEQSVFFA